MNKIKYYVLGLQCFLLIGCTSSTSLDMNPPLLTPKQVTQDLAVTEQNSLKRVVAIGRFTDETKRGTSFFLDDSGNKIGKQAADILASRLTSSNKFIMLERADINLVENEDNLQKVGANYLIVGSVSAFGRSTVSDVGIFSRNKIQKATATVNIRIIDTRTGQIIHSEEGSGEALSEASSTFGVGQKSGYDLSLDDQALSAAISKLTSNIMNNLLDEPWQSYVLSLEGGNVILAGGVSQGIKEKDEFDILIKGKTIKNPQTGLNIQLPANKIARVQVISLVGKGSNEITIASVISGEVNPAKLNEYIVQEVEK